MGVPGPGHEAQATVARRTTLRVACRRQCLPQRPAFDRVSQRVPDLRGQRLDKPGILATFDDA